MAAQAAYVNVNRARLDESVAPPHQVEQLLAGVNAQRMLHEKAQQFELAQRHLQPAPVDERLVSAEVHLEPAALETARFARLGEQPRPAQQCANAREHLARAERL